MLSTQELKQEERKNEWDRHPILFPAVFSISQLKLNATDCPYFSLSPTSIPWFQFSLFLPLTSLFHANPQQTPLRFFSAALLLYSLHDNDGNQSLRKDFRKFSRLFVGSWVGGGRRKHRSSSSTRTPGYPRLSILYPSPSINSPPISTARTAFQWIRSVKIHLDSVIVEQRQTR